MDSKIEYIKKLNNWNNSEKYLKEVEFLRLLLNPQKSDFILDYGCGTGYCLSLLKKQSLANFKGYDINYFFNTKETPKWFISDLSTNEFFTKIYFMHSFAHIKNINQVLSKVYRILVDNGSLYIITPNKDFDDYFRKLNIKNYHPDETVYKHYNIKEITKLLEKNGFFIRIVGQFGNIVKTFNERIFVVAKKNKNFNIKKY